MANIKIFGYKNKEGTESWKVALMVAKFPGGFGAISLGKALLSQYASSSFEDILVHGVAFKELDHRPRKGEGLTQFNDCYKAFNDSGVTFTLAEIPAEKVMDDIEGFKKAVAALKSADPASIKETVVSKKPSAGVTPEIIGAIGFLGIISESSNAHDLVALNDEYGDGDFSGGSSRSALGRDYGTDSDSPSDEDVKQALTTLAKALGYNITLSSI